MNSTVCGAGGDARFFWRLFRLGSLAPQSLIPGRLSALWANPHQIRDYEHGKADVRSDVAYAAGLRAMGRQAL